VGDRRVDVFHFKAEVVDLVQVAVAGLVFLEHLDVAAAAAIEVESENLAVAQEIELGVHAEDVPVEALRRFQVMREDADMSELLYLDHDWLLAEIRLQTGGVPFSASTAPAR
jgi:hypothetical protein